MHSNRGSTLKARSVVDSLGHRSHRSLVEYLRRKRASYIHRFASTASLFERKQNLTA